MDGSLHDVTEYEIEKVPFPLRSRLSVVKLDVRWLGLVPPQCNASEQDLCEDLSDLQSVNECGVLHTLMSRAKANMPLSQAGPNLINFWPPLQTLSKVKPNTRAPHLNKAFF